MYKTMQCPNAHKKLIFAAGILGVSQEIKL